MLTRIKKLWQLSKKNLNALDEISLEEIEKLPNTGNGKAIFIPMMTQPEYEEYIKNQQPWYKQLQEKLKELK